MWSCNMLVMYIALENSYMHIGINTCDVCIRLSLYLMGRSQERSNLKRLKLTPSIYVTDWFKTQGYSPLKTGLHFLFKLAFFHTSPIFFSHHTFKIKSLKPSNNPASSCSLLHLPDLLCSPNGTGPVIALLSFGGIPPFSSAMPPDWIAI